MRTRKRIGRPPKRIKNDNVIQVRLSAGYFDKLKKLALKLRMPVAATARNIVLDRLDGLGDF